MTELTQLLPSLCKQFRHVFLQRWRRVVMVCHLRFAGRLSPVSAICSVERVSTMRQWRKSTLCDSTTTDRCKYPIQLCRHWFVQLPCSYLVPSTTVPMCHRPPQYPRAIIHHSTHVPSSTTVPTYHRPPQYPRAIIHHSTHVPSSTTVPTCHHPPQYLRAIIHHSTHVPSSTTVPTCHHPPQYPRAIIHDNDTWPGWEKETKPQQNDRVHVTTVHSTQHGDSAAVFFFFFF